MPTSIAKVKTAALSKELSQPLPEPPTFEGKPGVRSIAGDLGDQYAPPPLSRTGCSVMLTHA